MDVDLPDCAPHLSFPSKYPIIASKPSEISEFFQGIYDVLNQLKSLDLEGISNRIKSALDNINQTIDDADVKGISTNIEASLEGVNRVFNDQRWGAIMASMEKAGQSLNSVLDEAESIVADDEKTIKTAMYNFKKAMENANSLLSGTDESQSCLRSHLLIVAQNLEKATDNLNRLIDLIADHPSQLILGQPPAPRKVK